VNARIKWLVVRSLPLFLEAQRNLPEMDALWFGAFAVESPQLHVRRFARDGSETVALGPRQGDVVNVIIGPAEGTPVAGLFVLHREVVRQFEISKPIKGWHRDHTSSYVKVR